MIFCANQGWTNIEVETDSLALTNILNNVWKIPWEILEMVEDIVQIKQERNILIKHVYKEGNQVADFIANIAINTDSKQVYNTFQQLSSLAK